MSRQLADCTWREDGSKWRCICCGFVAPRPAKRNCHDPCWTGLGDAVAWGLRKLGFKKKCGGCRKRQAALNKALPFSRLEALASEHDAVD